MYSQTSTGLRWRKSSHSNPQGTECVEVAHTGDRIAIRDSKDPDGPLLRFSPAAFATFITHTKHTP